MSATFPTTPDEWQKWLGRPRCCEEDFGGSHYHCARCNGVTGMYGHHKSGEFLSGKFRRFAESHTCCPGDCSKPEAHAGGAS